MPELEQLILTAREAYDRRDWAAARRGFGAARLRAPLDAPDLDALASSAWWLGDTSAALATAEELYHRLATDGDRTGAAMAALNLSLRWGTRGDLAVASGWLNRARRMLEGLPEGPPSGYLLYLEAGMTMDVEGDPAPARAAAATVEALAVRFGDPALACFARVLSGLARVREGQTEAGFRDLDEAMLPVLAGQVPQEWAGDIYCTVTHLCHVLGDFSRMRSWTTAMERWTAGQSRTFVYADVTRVHELQLLCTEGNWDAAERELRPLSDRLAQSHGWMAGAGYYELGEISRLRGDPAGALDAYARARALGVEPQPGEAWLHLATGERGLALEELRVALAECGPLDKARLLLAATELAGACGDGDLAATYCAELEQTAARYSSPGLRAWASHTRGVVLLAAARPADALSAFEAAGRIYRDQRARYSTAVIHELESSCRRSLGYPEAADADLATAAAIYRQLGAAPDLQRLQANLQRIRGSAPGGLTAREAEVLALVSGGASNRQVADALVISEKTVGRHLANIFGKIGVSSRTGAAAWAREHGLPGS
ncbi:ATP/maltotriose-dependent transcriptional regulator MalT [Arthrobacter globiformis]|uniref:LuxR family transcriptional regulator n=1 Tax=Arthrobacter globiformis TaxID=1665 RepID=UPI00278A408B|nr:LuxR family transcriptional regulator [Arthrobacter globiformis]MDQ1058689.1 ATP/maltotriose-dependent transcriptional regulator MalT [Arthrobacter globiformis]